MLILLDGDGQRHTDRRHVCWRWFATAHAVLIFIPARVDRMGRGACDGVINITRYCPARSTCVVNLALPGINASEPHRAAVIQTFATPPGTKICDDNLAILAHTADAVPGTLITTRQRGREFWPSHQTVAVRAGAQSSLGKWLLPDAVMRPRVPNQRYCSAYSSCDSQRGASHQCRTLVDPAAGRWSLVPLRCTRTEHRILRDKVR